MVLETLVQHIRGTFGHLHVVSVYAEHLLLNQSLSNQCHFGIQILELRLVATWLQVYSYIDVKHKPNLTCPYLPSDPTDRHGPLVFCSRTIPIDLKESHRVTHCHLSRFNLKGLILG